MFFYICKRMTDTEPTTNGEAVEKYHKLAQDHVKRNIAGLKGIDVEIDEGAYSEATAADVDQNLRRHGIKK